MTVGWTGDGSPVGQFVLGESAADEVRRIAREETARAVLESVAGEEPATFGTPTPQGLYLRPEFAELRDYSHEGIERVRARRTEQALRDRVALQIEALDRVAGSMQRVLDEARLILSDLNVISHESSPLRSGPEGATSEVPAATVAETTDIPSSPGVGASAGAVVTTAPALDPRPANSHVAATVGRLLAEQGIPAYRLAAHLGRTPSAMSRLLSGDRGWRAADIAATAALLRVSVADLFPKTTGHPSAGESAGGASSPASGAQPHRGISS